MNNKEQKLVHEAFKSLLTRLERVETFVLDQAPSICKEIITARTIRVKMDLMGSGIGAVVAVSILLTTIIVGLRTPSESLKAGMLFLGLILALATILCGAEIFDQLKEYSILKNCPKLVLIKELGKLVRGNYET